MKPQTKQQSCKSSKLSTIIPKSPGSTLEDFRRDPSKVKPTTAEARTDGQGRKR